MVAGLRVGGGEHVAGYRDSDARYPLFVDLASQRDGATTDDRFHALLRYDRLRVVLHATTLAAAESPRFVLHGTKGSWIKYGLDPQEDALKAASAAAEKLPAVGDVQDTYGVALMANGRAAP